MTEEEAFQNARPPDLRRPSSQSVAASIDELYRRVRSPLLSDNSASSYACIPVKLTQTGGSAGTNTVECSFTYTVKSFDGGTTLATGVALIGHRPVKAQMLAATYGIATVNSSGTYKIITCDEQIDQKNCT